MAAYLSGEFDFQAFSDNGTPLVGGRLYTYAYGTTTRKIAYTDAAGTVPHTYTSDGVGGQYIALDARGELPAPLYLTAGSYDIALKRADGSTVWTRRADPVGDVLSLTADLAALTVTKGAGLVGFSGNVNYAAGTLGKAVEDRSISITDQPWNCVSGAECGASIQAANDYLAGLGGGVLIFPIGDWTYSTSITRSANVTWRGVSSLGSKLRCLNSTAQVLHTGARGGIEHLYIEGPHTTQVARAAAASTSVGVIDNGATTWMQNVRIKYFKTGLRQTIGYWKEYTKLWCEENGIGMDFLSAGSDFCNLLTFYSCTWRQNDRNGIAGTATPVNNNVLSFINCDVENNCSEAPTTYPQIALGGTRGVSWLGGYMEAGTVSPAPDLWYLQNTSKAYIQPAYVGGARKAFFAGSNGAGDIEIKVPYFAGGGASITTSVYEFPSCSGVRVFDNTSHTAAIDLSGTNSELINKKIAQQETFSWTPTISGATTPGTPTYAVQVGRATRVGNFLHFSGRITVTAAGGATGNVRISLPVTHENISGLFSTGAVELTGITPTAGKTYFTGRIAAGTNYIEVMEGGNAAGMVQVQWANVAATSTFIVSGVFPITV